MARIVLYPAIALVAAQTAGAQNTSNWRQQPLNPEVFRRSFPVASQQYVAMPWQGNIPTTKTAHGWEGQQLDTRFATPFPVGQQQYAAYIPERVPAARDSQGFYPQPPDVFAKPFPTPSQQFNAFQPQGFIASIFPDGWRGLQWDYAFAKPFPPVDQQFLTHGPEHVPQPIDVEGWFGVQLEYKFSVPFPAPLQQFQTFTRGAIPTPAVPQGRFPQSPDQFAKPFPASSQQFTATFKRPDPITPQGWWPQPPDRFANPFPVTEQIFSVWDLVGEVPPFHPPGAGKRKHVPVGAPLPPYDVKPAKTFQPIWDRRKEDERRAAEQAAIPAAPPPGPPPLPPPSIFGAPMGQQQPTAMPTGLPTFDHLVPPDPMGLAQRMKEAQDMSDAIAVLKALGLNLGG